MYGDKDIRGYMCNHHICMLEEGDTWCVICVRKGAMETQRQKRVGGTERLRKKLYRTCCVIRKMLFRNT